MFNTIYYKNTNNNPIENNDQIDVNSVTTNVNNIVEEVKNDMDDEKEISNGKSIPHEIIKKLAQLSQWKSTKGSINSREANIVSWKGSAPRLDIRVWYKNNVNDPNEEWKPGKGVIMNELEAHMLTLALIEAGYAPGYHK